MRLVSVQNLITMALPRETADDAVRHSGATDAIEWEHGVEAATQSLLEQGPEAAACPEEARLHRHRVETEIAGDGQDAQPLGLAQEEDDAQIGGQATDGVFEQASDLGPA